ncbi:hypothetical protein GGR57DRAFT_494305 [Xylariaceae sp. FL1272]|nr:hypothetical protein GGR57DRAFT_494305 [Xylariaceae sp. FL1272]
MPLCVGTTSLRKRLATTDAVQQLERGRPDRRAVSRKNFQKCNDFLVSELVRCKGKVWIHEAAIILGHDLVQIASIRPDADHLGGLFPCKLKAFIQCILRAVGDRHVEYLFSFEFITQTLSRCDHWLKLNAKLESFLSSREWADAWALLKGIHHINGYPLIQEMLREQSPQCVMWAAWRQNRERIAKWKTPVLSKYAQRLGLILDLEGPDLTGQQHTVLRDAVAIGEEGVRCLVELCGNNGILTEKNVSLLAAILELNSPGNVAHARSLLQMSREYKLATSVHDRMSLLVSTLSILPLTAAQEKLHVQLLQKRTDRRLAIQTSSLARALLSARWLQESWTTEYFNMLTQVPTEAEIERSIVEITRGIESAREWHFAFMIGRVCAPVANSSPSLEAQETPQELSTFIVDDTDIVCVNLARYLGPLASRSLGLNSCWKHLLMGMMRRRPRNLLDRLGEDIESAGTWQEWLKNLGLIYGDGFLDPEGQLGFTKIKILKRSQRRMSLNRQPSDASTATSTGSLANPGDAPQDYSLERMRHSLGDAVEPFNDEAFPGNTHKPNKPNTTPTATSSAHHARSLRKGAGNPQSQPTRVEITNSDESQADIPWYERQSEVLRVFKPYTTSDGDMSQGSGALVHEDENIYD